MYMQCNYPVWIIENKTLYKYWSSYGLRNWLKENWNSFLKSWRLYLYTCLITRSVRRHTVRCATMPWSIPSNAYPTTAVIAVLHDNSPSSWSQSLHTAMSPHNNYPVNGAALDTACLITPPLSPHFLPCTHGWLEDTVIIYTPSKAIAALQGTL